MSIWHTVVFPLAVPPAIPMMNAWNFDVLVSDILRVTSETLSNSMGLASSDPMINLELASALDSGAAARRGEIKWHGETSLNPKHSFWLRQEHNIFSSSWMPLSPTINKPEAAASKTQRRLRHSGVWANTHNRWKLRFSGLQRQPPLPPPPPTPPSPKTKLEVLADEMLSSKTKQSNKPNYKNKQKKQQAPPKKRPRRLASAWVSANFTL